MRLLIGVLLLASPAALAWGPATHGYIAACVAGDWAPEVILGAMLPDCNALLRHNPDAARELKRLAHREPERLAPSAFATGFKTHNANWGADYYAHLCYDASAEDIYSTIKIRQLSDEFGLTMSHAEDVFEMCMDIQVRLKMGASLGALIAKAAENQDMNHEQVMVDAFAGELADRVADLSPEQAEQDIRAAVQIHKVLLVALGEQLQLGETEIHDAIPSLLSLHLGVDIATAATYYHRGLEITTDGMDELDRICAEITAIMSPMPEGESEDSGARLP